jgi:hypothetical protein
MIHHGDAEVAEGIFYLSVRGRQIKKQSDSEAHTAAGLSSYGESASRRFSIKSFFLCVLGVFAVKNYFVFDLKD